MTVYSINRFSDSVTSVAVASRVIGADIGDSRVVGDSVGARIIGAGE